MSLIDVLQRCRVLSLASQDALCASSDISTIVAMLDRGIESLARGAALNRVELKTLFAPTGALQETSMSNGWSNEYITLAAEFDELMV